MHYAGIILFVQTADAPSLDAAWRHGNNGNNMVVVKSPSTCYDLLQLTSEAHTCLVTRLETDKGLPDGSILASWQNMHLQYCGRPRTGTYYRGLIPESDA